MSDFLVNAVMLVVLIFYGVDKWLLCVNLTKLIMGVKNGCNY